MPGKVQFGSDRKAATRATTRAKAAAKTTKVEPATKSAEPTKPETKTKKSSVRAEASADSRRARKTPSHDRQRRDSRVRLRQANNSTRSKPAASKAFDAKEALKKVRSNPREGLRASTKGLTKDSARVLESDGNSGRAKLDFGGAKTQFSERSSPGGGTKG